LSPSKPTGRDTRDADSGAIKNKGDKEMYFICTTRNGFIARRFPASANLKALRRYYGRVVLTNAL
jgi:hypothetical protein